MKKFIQFFLISFSFLIILNACSSKNNGGLALDEVNKPADYWYQNMLKEIRNGDLEKADSYFTSLQSEHLNSPLLSEAMLILGRAHMQEEEYLLATFYFDEYTKRFGDEKNIDFISFLKLQANYFAFAKQFRDQQLLAKSIKDAQDFSQKYPYSRYRPIVDTMLLKLELANLSLNKEIIKLYEKKDKQQAAKYYQQKIDESAWIKDIFYQEAGSPWYQKIFEW
ncbi:MAG: outer membrane protein assembly factor BamD [Helicobacter sp.]|uniref:outer membrane protein assembly factor BamD n=1 Tax=Helicobacter TaxID=209 RepID=UPI00202A7193|nr:outer membrane protein assembly factor BamD [Helicobacter sp.]MCL9823090.1 outer membrane protein assembly factor BamD [Helicobacter colisuis]MDY4426511.1 outer membrane protein assembly factor BamD [Helicobacter sp.]MDY5616841.1 outer membrane protein assembly factor BamD [Helicobacter sp.]